MLFFGASRKKVVLKINIVVLLGLVLIATSVGAAGAMLCRNHDEARIGSQEHRHLVACNAAGVFSPAADFPGDFFSVSGQSRGNSCVEIPFAPYGPSNAPSKLKNPPARELALFPATLRQPELAAKSGLSAMAVTGSSLSSAAPIIFLRTVVLLL
jgi:hypothetical protein